jgi:hypothetical protein
MYYYASSIVVTTYQPFSGTGTQNVAFYRDVNKFDSYNFFSTWTYNSVNSRLPFDYYFGLGLFGQTLDDFKPTGLYLGGISTGAVINDNSTEVTTSYLMLMLGIYKNLDERNRLSFGVRVLKEFQIQNLSASVYLFPAIQWDMSF